VFDQPVAVDGLRDGATYLRFIQRFVSWAQYQKYRAQALNWLDLEAGIGFEPRYFMRRYIADQIRLSGFQRCDAGGIFFDNFIKNFLDFCRRSPIIFIAAHDEVAGALPANEFKWTGPDRRSICLSHLLSHRLLHDHAVVQIFKSGCVGFLECQDEIKIIG
jgi:hypothetical protein